MKVLECACFRYCLTEELKCCVQDQVFFCLASLSFTSFILTSFLENLCTIAHSSPANTLF